MYSDCPRSNPNHSSSVPVGPAAARCVATLRVRTTYRLSPDGQLCSSLRSQPDAPSQHTSSYHSTQGQHLGHTHRSRTFAVILFLGCASSPRTQKSADQHMGSHADKDPRLAYCSWVLGADNWADLLGRPR